MEENIGKPNTVSKGIIIVVLVAIVLLAGGVYEFNKAQSPSTPTKQVSGDTTGATPTTTAIEQTTSNYKDGTYSADGQYISPGGEEQIGVSVTLKDGKIADVTVEPKAFRPTSQNYQGLFASNYKPLVLGKNIDDVKLDEVSGSSLTPQGFNDAITKIKEQAKS